MTEEAITVTDQTKYASEWYAPGEAMAQEARAGALRSRLGTPHRLHRHRHGEACNDRCETIHAAVSSTGA